MNMKTGSTKVQPELISYQFYFFAACFGVMESHHHTIEVT